MAQPYFAIPLVSSGGELSKRSPTMTKVPLLERLAQRRTPDTAAEGTELKQCLGVFDLVNAGFSVMVGAGIFVITPVLTANTTGPAVTISYLIAGLASLISALTYAELAGRFEGIGSAYLYVYYVLGELAASIIGLSTLIESMIGLASIVKSLSIYTDRLLFNGTIIAYEERHFALEVPYMTDYVDLFGLMILFVCGALNLWGVKQTVVVSAACNVIVVVSLVTIVIAGFILGSTDNWFGAALPADVAVTYDASQGGYMPYGVAGVFTGASLAYFSYNGFDCIASLGCEAKNPQRDIPIAIVISFGLVMTLYILVCGAITYVAPYYTLGNEAGMALAFSSVPWVMYVISLGAVLATATGSFAAILTTSRIMFSMAQDGIVFKQLSCVSKHMVPVVSILVSMVLPSMGILLLNIEELVMMNSGGMLICFCLTNICVIVGRYQPHYSDGKASGKYTGPEKYSLLFSLLLWVLCLLSNVCLIQTGLSVVGVVMGIFFLVLAIVTLVFISKLFTEVDQMLGFRCPLVPWLPGLGVYVNSTLMVSLPLMTWIRVGVCLFLGLLCYLCYGLSYSNVTLAKKQGFRAQFELESPEPKLARSPDSFKDNDKLVGNEY